MGEALTLRCPNCGEPISLQISKVIEQCSLIDEVKKTIDDWIEDVDITEEKGSVIVMPKGFLGKDIWYEINDALNSLDAEWVSAGKESRWIVREGNPE
jgi:hypothetical protein